MIDKDSQYMYIYIYSYTLMIHVNFMDVFVYSLINDNDCVMNVFE